MRPPRKGANGSGGAATGVVRCAIYTRKSTDEGLDRDFNTLDAQREAAEAYVASQAGNGWAILPDKYDDGGYSGGNVERPALQRLLADVRAGKVQRVLVYKIDRLTRSLLDFAELARTFEQHGVGIVSVTQQFDTATSYGRLTLNMLLSFAQFEREMVSDRTRDKLRAARRKGKFVGGGLILGYDLAPGGGGIVVNAAEAERVRAIFRLFLESGSIVETVAQLNHRGWTLKRWTTKTGRAGYGGGPFDVNNLRRMLQNPAYVAEVHFEGQIVPAEHDAILDRATWDAVQSALDAGIGKPQCRSTKNASLLAGILRCTPCDSAMTPTYSGRNGRRYRYYLCLKAHRQGWASCPSKSVPAIEVEQFVVDKVRAIGRDPELVAATVEASRQALTTRWELETEVGRLQNDLDEVHSDIRKGMVGLSRNHLGLSRPATSDQRDNVQRLEDALTAARRELEALRSQRIAADDLRAALASFNPVWDHLTSQERARVVQLLIEQIDYDGGTGSLKITFAPAGVRTLAAEAGR